MTDHDAPTSGPDAGLDKPVLAALLIVAATLCLYLVLIAREGDRPAGWFLQMALLGAACAAYGLREMRGKLTALWMATIIWAILGTVGIFSIGLPLLIAAGLCGFSGLRALPRLMTRR